MGGVLSVVDTGCRHGVWVYPHWRWSLFYYDFMLCFCMCRHEQKNSSWGLTPFCPKTIYSRRGCCWTRRWSNCSLGWSLEARNGSLFIARLGLSRSALRATAVPDATCTRHLQELRNHNWVNRTFFAILLVCLAKNAVFCYVALCDMLTFCETQPAEMDEEAVNWCNFISISEIMAIASVVNEYVRWKFAPNPRRICGML